MRSLTQLVGDTTTTSATNYPTAFTTLSNNNTAPNVALAKLLVSDHHRYLLQKYFDNEDTYTTVTIGGEDIVLPTAPVVNATSATLSVAWPHISCQQLVVFGDGEQRTVTFIKGSTTISWITALNGKNYDTTAIIAAGATTATLSTAWPETTQTLTAYFSDGESKSILFTNGSTAISWVGGLTGGVEAFVRTLSADTTISTVGVQFYPIPPRVSKIKNNTITVGQLVFTPSPVQSIQEWTILNTLPYTSDIPNQFFIYNNQVGFYPTPSTSGNLISFNYKSRVPDLTFTDYSTGTLSGIAVGSNSITGASTSWNTTGTYPLNTDVTIFNLYLKITPPSGEGIWYKIQSFQSDTALTLTQPIQNAPSATATAYVIGQMPLLAEDFHDMLVYGPLQTYFAAIVPDATRFKMYDTLYKERLVLLETYAGTKSVNVDLGEQVVPNNPNLYLYAPN